MPLMDMIDNMSRGGLMESSEELLPSIMYDREFKK